MVATFQSTVNIWSALGVVGDMAFDGPLRAEPYNLFSSGTPNIIGNAFTVTSGGNPEPSGNSAVAGTATVGGTGVFAGILVNSKDYASYGTTDRPARTRRSPCPTIPSASLPRWATSSSNLPGPANVGDLVTYDPLTGNLNSITPTTKFTGINRARWIGRRQRRADRLGRFRWTAWRRAVDHAVLVSLGAPTSHPWAQAPAIPGPTTSVDQRADSEFSKP